MPRRRQGGPVEGQPGTRYPNRTDLARQPSIPARAAPNQTYGNATSQLQAQRVVPMAPPRLALPQPGPAAPGPAAPPSGTPFPGAGGAAPTPGPAPGGIPPGALGDLHRPTERLTEPVTAGAALGAGPGPSPLAIPALTAGSQVSTLLAQAGQKLGSTLLANLATRAQAAGQ